MKQRQSLAFPQRPPSFPSEEERISQTVAIVKYFIEEDRCLVPSIFFNVEEFKKVVLDAAVSNTTFLDPIVLRTDFDAPEDDILLAVNTLTLLADEIVGIVINFDLGNTIAIVGSKDQYYFIDLFHDICYVTQSPEYDVMAYESEYGESTFKAWYYSLPPQAAAAATVGEKRPEPAVAAVPPAPKKKKVVKKAAAQPPLPPAQTETCEAK